MLLAEAGKELEEGAESKIQQTDDDGQQGRKDTGIISLRKQYFL